MKHAAFVIATTAAAVLSVSVLAQSVPQINYDAVADLISLPSYGEVAGVATNSRGHLFVYARTGHAVATLGDERTFYHGGSRLFQFDQTGKFVKEIGQGVDAGSNQVVKFDVDGRFQMVLGRKPENITLRPGAGVSATAVDAVLVAARGPAPPGGPGGGGGAGANTGQPPGSGINGDNFNRPSDVTWDRAGNVYVADGFGTNSRIAKFNKDGNFLKTWGNTGTGQGQFSQIRGIASDAAGNIYVADAGNKRIQVFDGEGTFKSQIGNIGTPQAICISGGATPYLYSSNSNDSESMDSGEIYKLQLSGQVVGRFGKAGKLAKEFGMVNAIDCRTENDLWVGEVWNWRAQKVTLKR